MPLVCLENNKQTQDDVSNYIGSVQIYDTTLRDGAQSEDVSFSVEDKLRITLKLDELGIHYIEGGWPGANQRDTDFFNTARKLTLDNATIVAFGSTHRPRVPVADDKTVKALLEASTPVVTIFGKSWDFHVREALKITLDENLGIIYDTIRYLKERVDKVFYDAEHFFDGYKAKPDYALKTLQAAHDAGADCLVLCDTNGGTLPDEAGKIIDHVSERFDIPFGIHAHNDSECAVANSLVAVVRGAAQVQGTINGLGERCGNANLISIIPNLMLKLHYHCLPEANLKMLREVSRFVTELANLGHMKRQPFVGDSAFAHKAGVHVSAIQKHRETYEHIEPELVGNYHKVLVSDLSGKSNIVRKAVEFGLKIQPDSPQIMEIVKIVKDLENQGYEFEGAEASFELLMRKTLGQYTRFFDLISFNVTVLKRKNDPEPYCEATIMMTVGGRLEHTAGTGNGPVNALDNALRKALYNVYPELKTVTLIDYKVRVLSTGDGTTAKVRVLIESSDNIKKWNTVGVSENIIEASWQALVDSIEYKLLQQYPLMPDAARTGES
jgi:2-isopropylmalate synthase